MRYYVFSLCKCLLLLCVGCLVIISSLPAQSRLPDYSQDKDWLASPFKSDPSDMIPGGETVKAIDSTVDIFFIFPTSYTSKVSDGKWNAELDDSVINQVSLDKSIKYQASIFNKVGRVFAPNYRQANLQVFWTQGAQSKQALDLAYHDILAAWQYYLHHFNQGRSFIIAGHSQGAFLAARLLKEEIDGKDLANHLIAAYIPGMPIRKTDFRFLQACKDSTSTGCIASWRSFLDGYTPEYIANEPRESMIVTNPISWTDEEIWSNKSQSKGAVLYDFNVAPKPGIIRAQVHNNILWIKKPDIRGKFLLTRKNYHIGDFNLYYMDIQTNALLRVSRFKAKFNK